jgi:hypothetical protein
MNLKVPLLALALSFIGARSALSQSINVAGVPSTMMSQCNHKAARECRSGVSSCFDICNRGPLRRRAVTVRACHQGCLHRYEKCRKEAGCR